MPIFKHVFKVRILANPFLLYDEGFRGTTISNFKLVLWVVFEIRRLLSEWYRYRLNIYIIKIQSPRLHPLKKKKK